MAACEGQETEYILAMNFRDPTVLRDVTVPSLLARVMAVRAARAKLRQEAPKTNPAIDYSHM